MKIKIKYNGKGIFAITEREDYLWAEKRLTVNKIYDADLKTRRNLREHNLYWLMLEAVAFHLGGSAATWHEWLKARFMNPEIIKLKSGEVVELPKSESFRLCTEIEFKAYFMKVQEFFLSQGYSPEEMIDTAC